MQADGGLVEHVAHALQIAAQLRSQADALRFAAAQRGRAAVERQIAQPDLIEKGQAALDLAHHIARDRGLAAVELELLDPAARVLHRTGRDLRDRVVSEAHGQRARAQARAVAGAAGGVAHVFDFRFGKSLLAALFFIDHRIVEHLALLARERQTGADAIGAPAVLAVVAEQPRVELGVRGGTLRAGPQCGKHAQTTDPGRGAGRLHRLRQAIQITEHVQHAFAMLQGQRQVQSQCRLVVRRDIQAEHRQLNGVLLEAVQTREGAGRQKIAVHAQMRKATQPRPVGQLGVNALAVDHQRGQQADVLAAKIFQQLRRNALWRLRCHRGAVMNAVLGAELDKQQPQKMPDLGGGSDG
ncbi:hypothetical protein GALL_494010 [mine drainage metagenome]|uniref:Uncharacterized protein n=1 Tax=mine drainage metagenome TaxID=410659 RepID=A0A1J5PBG1_9ZZZZ